MPNFNMFGQTEMSSVTCVLRGEDAIRKMGSIAEVAVVGVPHETWVETPRAVVVPVDPADPPTLEEIVEHCRTRLASYTKPTSLVVLDALPRTASGKVQKFRLRDGISPGA